MQKMSLSSKSLTTYKNSLIEDIQVEGTYVF